MALRSMIRLCIYICLRFLLTWLGVDEYGLVCQLGYEPCIFYWHGLAFVWPCALISMALCVIIYACVFINMAFLIWLCMYACVTLLEWLGIMALRLIAMALLVMRWTLHFLLKWLGMALHYFDMPAFWLGMALLYCCYGLRLTWHGLALF